MFLKAGFSLFHFESANSVPVMLEQAGKMKLTGCVNNPTVLLNGNKETVFNSVNEILRHGITIISPECAVPLDTPNANLKAISECAIAHGGHLTIAKRLNN